MAWKAVVNKQDDRTSEHLSIVAINCRYRTGIILIFQPFFHHVPHFSRESARSRRHFATGGKKRTRREEKRYRNLLVFLRFIQNAMQRRKTYLNRFGRSLRVACSGPYAHFTFAPTIGLSPSNSAVFRFATYVASSSGLALLTLFISREDQQGSHTSHSGTHRGRVVQHVRSDVTL